MKIKKLIKELKAWKMEFGNIEVTLGQYNESEDNNWEAHLSNVEAKEVNGLVVLSIY